MSKREYIAYKGNEYTIEWYYDKNGRSETHEYLLKLESEMQKKIYFLFKRMGDFGKINDKTKFRYEGNQIYAFKPHPNRFLSFFTEKKRIIVTNAFHKKSNKLPKNEKEKAIKIKKDYLKRVKRRHLL